MSATRNLKIAAEPRKLIDAGSSNGPDQIRRSWQCPVCRGQLAVAEKTARCATCDLTYPKLGGIWRFLPDTQAREYDVFLTQYGAVRASEGWGAGSDAYYQALPYVERADPQASIWRTRAASYEALVARRQISRRYRRRALAVLDLGAGNCWLAHRLARLGHDVVAVDISLDPRDGLAACARYRMESTENEAPAFTVVQSDFDHLPLPDRQFDLVVFNGSFHYSTDYALTLRESLRVLRDDGEVVIMDSPCFHDAASGNRMVQKREARFAQMYGFAGNSLACEGYLTDDQRRSLSRGLDVRWKTIQPAPTWRQAGRQVRSLVRGHGEVATFPLLVATRRGRVDDSSGACSLGSRARRWLGREIQRWRFRLFQQRRLSQIVVEEVAGRPILVLPHVFNPKVFRSGAFLAESLSANLIPERSAVLDLGTGSGVAAIAAAEWADHIVGVDVNPVAVRCARLNALLNYAEGQIEIREGDLFSPVAGERFDVILFNPPYYRGEPRDLADRAWRSVDVVERFAAELPRYLTSAGRALVALSTDGETNAFLDCFRQCNLAIDVVAERVTLNETFTLYSLRTYA